MATGGGWSYHLVNVVRHHKHPTELVFRQVYWARYIDWSIGTSLALIELTVLAGLPGAEILLALFADITMILFVHLCEEMTYPRVFLPLSRMEK
jgi:bacteriorhodopsin